MDFTVAAFHGPKLGLFSELVEEMQAALCSSLGSVFSSYGPDQVHATIIGLEGWRNGHEVFNRNASQVVGEPIAMELEGLFFFMRSIIPLHIRLGGFIELNDYPFTSRGSHPFLRSFSFNGSLAVAMGWPFVGNSYTLALDALRRECRRYKVFHKYHWKPDDLDNDLYFVLGRVDYERVSDHDIQEVQDILRRLLSAREPLELVVRPEDLSIVAYTDTRLPQSSSIRYSIDEALERVEELKLLYSECSHSWQFQVG